MEILEKLKKKFESEASKLGKKVATGVQVDEDLLREAILNVGIEEFERIIKNEKQKIIISSLEKELVPIKDDFDKSCQNHLLAYEDYKNYEKESKITLYGLQQRKDILNGEMMKENYIYERALMALKNAKEELCE